MKIDFEGKEYTLDFEDIDLGQATIIQSKTGLSLLRLQAALEEGDASALRAIYWLMMNQSGVTVDFDRINFKIVRFFEAVQKASEAEGSGEENPT